MRRKENQGFVLLVVMMAVAALSVMVWLQADTAVGDRLASIAVKQDVQARGIAERCLQEAVTFARHTANRAVPPAADFDIVLDPTPMATQATGTGTGAWPADLFQPQALPSGAGTAVLIHEAASGNARAEAFHRYTLLPMDQGACLIRYDDNQDDFVALPGGTDGALTGAVPENAGANEPRRDRDRAMIVTAIGIYPFNGVADNGAYQRARSRVTMRAVLQTEITATSGSYALTVGGTINVDDLHICGAVGGFAAGPGIPPSGSMCTCGETAMTGSISHCHTGDCGMPWGGNACVSQSNSGPVMTTPLPVMEWPIDLTSATPAFPGGVPLLGPSGGADVPFIPDTMGSPTDEWFVGDATTAVAPLSGANIGGLSSNGNCEFWFGNITSIPASPTPKGVMYWDHTDPNAKTTVDAFAGVIVDVATDDDCTLFDAASPIPEPCSWTVTSGALLTLNYACGPGQSLCWKFAAGMGGGTFNLGDATESTVAAAPPNETFKPVGSTSSDPLQQKAPLSYDGSVASGVSVTWESLCGAITDNTLSAGVRRVGNQWRVPGQTTAGRWGANGTYWFFDNAPTAATRVLINGEIGADGAPIQLGILAKNNVQINSARVNAYCPQCTNLASPCDRSVRANSSGHFLWAPYGHCLVGSPDELIGHVTCRTVRVEAGIGDGCMIGNVHNTGYCRLERCSVSGGSYDDLDVVGTVSNQCFTTDTPCSSPGICIDQSLTLVGDLIGHGDILVDQSTIVAEKIVASHLGTDAIGLVAAARNSICGDNDAQLFASDFIFVGRDLHLEWGSSSSASASADLWSPRIYVANDIDMSVDQTIRGWDPSCPTCGTDADIYIGNNFNTGSSGNIWIEGRVRVVGNFNTGSSSTNVRIQNNGTGGTVTVSVREENIWMEQPW